VTGNGGTPCGACRQVLAEFGLDTLVLIADADGNLKQETRLDELLPGAFGPGDLGK
jgi:cytidine deaminase